VDKAPMNMPQQQIVMHLYYTQSITGPSGAGLGVGVRFDSVTVDSPLMVPPPLQAKLESIRGLTTSVTYDDRRNVLDGNSATAGGTATNEQLVKGVRGLAFPFPEGPVGVGDSWTAEVDLPLGQVGSASAPFKAKSKFTVKEIDTSGPDTTVHIGLETTVPSEPIEMAQQGQSVKMKMTGVLTGEQVFSITRGATVHSQLGGTIAIDVTGGSLGDKGMHMTMTQAMSLTLGGAP
jgi:hypothetical protein